MAKSSTKKWKHFFISLLIVVLLLALLLFISLLIATDIERSRPRPWAMDTCWVSLDPYFVLDYRYVDGEPLEENAVLEINGEIQEVYVGYIQGTYRVFTASKTDDYIEFHEYLFIGSWKYRGDKLVFNVKYDYVFDGAYKEIVFEPKARTEQDTQPE